MYFYDVMFYMTVHVFLSSSLYIVSDDKIKMINKYIILNLQLVPDWQVQYNWLNSMLDGRL